MFLDWFISVLSLCVQKGKPQKITNVFGHIEFKSVDFPVSISVSAAGTEKTQQNSEIVSLNVQKLELFHNLFEHMSDRSYTITGYDKDKALLFPPNKSYILKTSLASDYVLNVNQDQKQEGKLVLWKDNHEDYQFFRFVFEPQHQMYTIVSWWNQKCVSAVGGSTRLATDDYKGTSDQLWRFFETGGQKGEVFIINKNGYCLDVRMSEVKCGTQILQYGLYHTKNQKWILQEIN